MAKAAEVFQNMDHPDDQATGDTLESILQASPSWLDTIGYDASGTIVVLRIGSTGSDPETWDWPTLLDEDPDNVELVLRAFAF